MVVAVFPYNLFSNIGGESRHLHQRVVAEGQIILLFNNAAVEKRQHRGQEVERYILCRLRVVGGGHMAEIGVDKNRFSGLDGIARSLQRDGDFPFYHIGDLQFFVIVPVGKSLRLIPQKGSM